MRYLSPIVLTIKILIFNIQIINGGKACSGKDFSQAGGVLLYLKMREDLSSISLSYLNSDEFVKSLALSE